MNYEKVKATLMQGEEREAAKLFQELLRQSVRTGLFGAMAEEVEALCGPATGHRYGLRVSAGRVGGRKRLSRRG